MSKPMKETIQNVETYEIFKSNFYQYGMSVIKDRAIPDIRDGLKPVHRAIIYEMLSSRATSKNKPVKVAKISGAVIGNWHPHGNIAVEEALTGLAATWKSSLPPIEVIGNKGSVFGDSAAAARYIEARLSPIGDAYGYKLKKGIVPYIPNFDDTSEMPTILPAQLPYTLLNGINDGIAVGVATALPPHNVKEVLEMVLQYLKKPKTKLEDLLAIMPGPDFPTGATIINKEDLLQMYETGYGKLTVRATIEYEKKTHTLHIKEIPYLFAGAMDKLVMKLVVATSETMGKNKKKIPPSIEGVLSVDDYSGKDGIDIAITLRKGVDPEQILQTLYAKTPLETTVKFNFQALNDKRLHQYSLRQYLKEYTDFQHEIVSNEFTLEYEALSQQLEILTGRLIMSSMIDEIVDVVKHSNSRAEVKDVLMNGTILTGTNPKYHKLVKTFRFTPIQAEAISGIPLYQLNRLDIERLKQDGMSVQKQMEYAKRIIDDEKYRHKLIIARLKEERRKLPDIPRKTNIINAETSKVANIEIPEVPMYIAMDKYGYVRIESKPFENAVQTSNKARIGFFDEYGHCWNLYLDRMKDTKDRGTLISQLINTTNKIIGFTSHIRTESKESLFIYQDGNMKRCDMSKFMTKTRATKINSRNTNHILFGVYDIPSDKNIVEINKHIYPLNTIPLQTASGNGKQMLTSFEKLDVKFTQGKVQHLSPTKKLNIFDGVVVFDGSDTITIDWSTTDTSLFEGLYVTTYQELVKNELVFIHIDGTAKRVDGKQFVVKTKRTSLQADKTGMQSIYIAPLTMKTLYAKYTDGTEKRVETSKISKQGKLGGGVRVFYTEKHILNVIENGDIFKDVQISTFAMQPK